MYLLRNKKVNSKRYWQRYFFRMSAIPTQLEETQLVFPQEKDIKIQNSLTWLFSPSRSKRKRLKGY